MSTSVDQQAIVNKPLHVPAPGRRITWGIGDSPQQDMLVMLEGWQSSMRCTIAIHEVPAGGGAGLHTHLLEDEAFFVLEGEVTFQMPDDGLELTARAGEFVWHPARRLHGFTVSENGPARLLQWLFPGSNLVPKFFERIEGEKGAAYASEEDVAELLRWSREDFGLILDAPEDQNLPPRPTSTRGPMTPEARVIDPPDATTVANVPFKSDASDVRTLQIGRRQMTDVKTILHAFGHQTGNVFAMHEVIWQPGDVAGFHVHTLEDQGFYILGGELSLTVSGPEGVARVVAREGDVVWAPRDMPHYYEVTGDEGARVLSFGIPGTTLMNFFYGIVQGQGADIESDEKNDAFARWAADNWGLHFVPADEFPEH
jgi:quercetin dioxygenase-like cupin family protein